MIRIVAGFIFGGFLVWLAMVALGYTPADGELLGDVAVWVWDGVKSGAAWALAVRHHTQFFLILCGALVGAAFAARN